MKIQNSNQKNEIYYESNFPQQLSRNKWSLKTITVQVRIIHYNDLKKGKEY